MLKEFGRPSLEFEQDLPPTVHIDCSRAQLTQEFTRTGNCPMSSGMIYRVDWQTAIDDAKDNVASIINVRQSHKNRR